MEDKEKQTKVFDILDKMEFFQGQRAGRELWNDKPKEVQDKDISDFIKDINYIRSYLQDSVVLSREEYNLLINTKKFFETADSEISAGNLLVYLKEFKEEASKETAEKIFNDIIQELEERKARVKAFYGVAESVGADVAIRAVKNLAKQFGVEVEE